MLFLCWEQVCFTRWKDAKDDFICTPIHVYQIFFNGVPYRYGQKLERSILESTGVTRGLNTSASDLGELAALCNGALCSVRRKPNAVLALQLRLRVPDAFLCRRHAPRQRR